MDEQQMNEGLLCDADRQLIASAARLQKYVEAPVPAGLLGELSDDLLKLAFIPYASRSKLSSLYGPGLDFMSLVSADWREAFSQGVLRMHNAKTISFPTHIEMARPLRFLSPRMHRKAGLRGFCCMFPLSSI